MVSSSVHGSVPLEPASYQHMEQALSKAMSKPGEDTQELTGGPSNSLQESDGVGATTPHTTDTTPVGNAPEPKSDTHKAANPILSTPEVSGGHQEEEPLKSGGKPSNECSSTPATPQVGSSTMATLTSNSPSAEESGNEKSELRPLAPSPVVALSPALEPFPSGILLEQPSSSTQEVSKSASSSPTSCSPTNTQGSSTKPRSGSSLRRGKWTVEEETYVARVIQDFNSGFLNAPAGTTLRSYLSDKLQCDPMRITKKFTGDACIGKRVFHPAVRSTANAASIDKAQAELDTLERRWRRRLEMQQRESAKKAAASQAAANAANGIGRDHTMIQGVPVALLSGVGESTSSNTPQIGQHVVTQAASWLDRANAILKGGHLQNFPIATMGSTGQASGESIDSMPNSEIENQMKEVQRLIFEGPRIQQTAAGLPNLLATHQRHSSGFEGPPTPPEPADKRMRTGGTITGAEDAEALVGFLRSVRASAAGGQDSS
mmetsp:Transcript_97847/g.273956  ORF Transcript_97847/g.273956 Transcript_97847/m.273956 type:complete len:489 (+) Transcript_97847:425-1891(+)